MKNYIPNKAKKLALCFAPFIAAAGAAMAQTTVPLGEAAQDAVNDSITTSTPILATVLGFSILVGMIFVFAKKR